MSWYNLYKYCICKCCVGCIDSEFPHNYVINQTEEFIKELKYTNKPIEKYY